VDRAGVRTLGFGISSDLAHQGMVDSTGYTVKGYLLSQFLGSGLRPIDEERHDPLLNRLTILAGQLDGADLGMDIGGGGNCHLGSDFRIFQRIAHPVQHVLKWHLSALGNHVQQRSGAFIFWGLFLRILSTRDFPRADLCFVDLY
jgi:hypothetical protein